VVKKRLVEDEVVEKRVVVVALVEVLLRAVKFWRVVEPVTRRLPVVKVSIVFTPVVKWLLSVRRVEEAALPMVTAPQVTLPFTTFRALPAEQGPVARYKLVVEAVVEKRVVVVALVEVLLRAVKFWRVEEPVTRALERVVRPEVMVTVPVKLAAELIV
jgi:uncharacterized protein YqcC (DUF446 family)